MVERKRRYGSVKEVEAALFPNSVLDRLEDGVCEWLGLEKGSQTRLVKDEDNPRTGLLEIGGYYAIVGDVERILRLKVGQFYREESYRVDARENDRMMVMRKGDDEFWVSVIKSETEIVVVVVESPIDKVERTFVLGG